MQTTQLELNLWDELEQASIAPEQADLSLLWQELEQLLAGLPQELKLQTAGKAIGQIAEVFALRSDSLLSAWEESHSDEGPAVGDAHATEGRSHRSSERRRGGSTKLHEQNFRSGCLSQ